MDPQPVHMLPEHLNISVTHATNLWRTGKQGIVATQYATSDDENLGTLVLTNPGAVVRLHRPFCDFPYGLLLVDVKDSANYSCALPSDGDLSIEITITGGYV